MKTSILLEYVKAVCAGLVRTAGTLVLSAGLTLAFLAFQVGDSDVMRALAESWWARFAASAASRGVPVETWVWGALALVVALVVFCPLLGFLITRWRTPGLPATAILADQSQTLTVPLDAKTLLQVALDVLAADVTLRDAAADPSGFRATARSIPFSNRSSWWAAPQGARFVRGAPIQRGWLRQLFCRLDLPFIGGPRREVTITIAEAGGAPEGRSTITIRSRFHTWLPSIDPFATNRLAAMAIADEIAAQVPRLVAERRADDERAQLESRLTDARLQVLRAQIEPHFLYNTLANVQYLIRNDTASADLMVGELITYLRQSLPRMRDTTSTVGGELSLARAYLNVMRIRMGGRLSVVIDAPPALLDHAFPPMMLMSLVENAIKHGVEPKAGPGEIRIDVTATDSRLRVAVRDDGVGFGTSGGSGIGLRNIHETLASMFGTRARLVAEPNPDAGVTVTLDIPLGRGAARMPPPPAPPPAPVPPTAS